MIKRNQYNQNRFRFFTFSLLLLVFSVAQAEIRSANPLLKPTDILKPAISIIIDDMGYRLKSGNRAVNLPGAIAYSFLPHSPHASSLSQLAYQHNKEIMLHLPMEAMSGKELGPGGLTQCMTEQKFSKVLEANIKSIPYISGFNNHMGSLLTGSAVWMKKLMRQVATTNNLFFVDSKTTSESVALKIAKSEGVKSIQRDIFIDHVESEQFILKQLDLLIKRAKRKGTALAIAHPKKVTLAILEKWLPQLEAKGIQLVPVSTLITLQQQRKLALWKPIK